MSAVREVGISEAKTDLARLVDEVSRGAVITITKHGTPVAVLSLPPGASHRSTTDVIQAIREFRRGKRLGDLSPRDLIEEGRR